MDAAHAHQWFAQLVGTEVGGWRIESLLDFGKSAIVTKAVNAGQTAALKIFEPELVERYGLEMQSARIARETALIGQSLPNLVQILGGGQSGDLLYVAMEFLPSSWVPLSRRLLEVPRDRIWPLLADVARAARALEGLKIAHRDIKPENVMVRDDFSEAKLLDLGVIRPIGASSLTDESYRPFIGTLRYSSPEFLMREEKDTIQGWRATTFYQLGGVLHDMIMRKPLFQEFSEPFARLTKAVQEQQPTIEAPDVHTDLVLLCRNCLLKEPQLRLDCVSWQNFEIPSGPAQSPAEAARERVKKRLLIGKQSPMVGATEAHAQRLRDQVKEMIAESLKSVVRETMAVDEFPAFRLVNIACTDPDRTRCSLRFGPSPEHGISSEIEIVFEAVILDANERVCRVSRKAASSSIHAEDDQLFFGVFEHEGIRIVIRDQLYLLLDRIQQDK